MRRSFDPALLTTVLTLACACSIASDEVRRESVEPLPDPAQFDQLCEELMSQVLHQGTVNFAESNAELGTSGLGMLDEIVEIAFDCPSLVIAVTGHTDNRGNEAANHALSRARAETVVAYLAEHGIDPARLHASGAGSDKPIASNEDAAGRQVNRRIEFGLSFRRTMRAAPRFFAPL
jgi:OmpA-OmpF porin, OOP family